MTGVEPENIQRLQGGGRAQRDDHGFAAIQYFLVAVQALDVGIFIREKAGTLFIARREINFQLFCRRCAEPFYDGACDLPDPDKTYFA